MKDILLALFWLGLVFVLASDMEITFKPFSLSFPKYISGIGMILIIFGFFFITHDIKNEYYQKGGEYVIKILTDKIKQEKNNK